MNFIPDVSTMAAFTLAAIVLILSPGPDMALVLGKSIGRGRKIGLATYAGTTTGSILHSVFASLGITALLAASPIAFGLLKVSGIAYLLWLAYKTVRHGSALTLIETKSGKDTIWHSWSNGFLVNLINPKAVIFFVTFLPQFVSASDPYAGQKLLFLGLYLCLLALPFYIGIIWMASKFSFFMQNSPKFMRAFDYIFATLIGSFALKMISTKAN